ncbi:MAG: hypothetical protein RRB22_01310 [Gammaproteobacteria bacterium]|nr:hypothetical protein [Gammaproteobacteria bacterium]
MAKRRWKGVQASSQQHAIRLCLDYAQQKQNLSVPRVADLIGTTEWAVYKWLSNGYLPSNKIRPFEHACGCTFVTQYIAASAHKLVVDIPKGAKVDDASVLGLQTSFNDAINLLARFYKDSADADETISALTSVMSQIAGHRENVSKTLAPELGLFEEAEE